MYPFLLLCSCQRWVITPQVSSQFASISKDITKMRSVLILNPVSGESAIAEAESHAEHEQLETSEDAILHGLQAHNITPDVWYTTPEDPGAGLANKAVDEGRELVIVAGGDGTVHAVASALIGRECVLGIIPMGSMNNLAHSLGIPLPIDEACAVIATGEPQSIDVGQINGQAFIEVAGVGLEAALFPAAEEFKTPGLLMTIRGVLDGLRTLLAFKPARLKISFDGTSGRPYDAIQVTICNAPYYGLHFQVAPDAVMDDGLLDIVIYSHFSKLEYLLHSVSISQGRRVYQPKITHRRAKTLRISANERVEVQADGFPHGFTPVEVKVMPGALRVLSQSAHAPGLRGRGVASVYMTPMDIN
jgi:diacylglycerol kinase (ATP)